jgi:hypothetical protein
MIYEARRLAGKFMMGLGASVRDKGDTLYRAGRVLSPCTPAVESRKKVSA